MLNCYTRTYKAAGNGDASYVNRVEVEVYYAKGGINYFTYKNEPRGYYFSISGHKLVDHGNGLLSREFIIGKGAQGQKWCILPCERQSKKRYEEAKAQIDELIDRFLGRWLEENDIILESLEYEVEERDRINR